MENISIVSERDKVKFYLEKYSFHPLLNRFREAKEQQAKLTKILNDENRVCVAQAEGKIIGYTLILPPEENERWSLLDYIKVLGVLEVTPPYRGKGVAKNLLEEIVKDSNIENCIILSLEYAWHWDLDMVGGDIELYKSLLKGVLSAAQFVETKTDDPDIFHYKHNFMMARFGQEITSDQLNQFMKLANLNSIY